MGQVSWYMPYLSYLFWASSCCVDNRLSVVLSVVNSNLIFVFLNSFMMNLVSFPTYVNFAHFTFWLPFFFTVIDFVEG